MIVLGCHVAQGNIVDAILAQVYRRIIAMLTRANGLTEHAKPLINFGLEEPSTHHNSSQHIENATVLKMLILNDAAAPAAVHVPKWTIVGTGRTNGQAVTSRVI